jgi:PAS domain S-box-containing protein
MLKFSIQINYRKERERVFNLQKTAGSVGKQEVKISKSQLFSSLNLLVAVALILGVIGFYFLSRYNYLLFHSTIEVFTLVVAIAIFTIAWNSRKTIDNNYLAFIGIAFLFIAGIDLLHTLTYKGMGVFPDVNANLATQLWIAMRYLFALSLLIPLLFIRRRIKPITVLSSYAIVTAFLILSIFYWNIFPIAYVDGVGLTAFKIGSEYVISIILTIGIALLIKNRKQFSDDVFKLLLLAMVMAIATEMAFTLYTDVYGIANMVGHLLDFFSFFLIYKALVETGFSKPYDLLFRNLKQNEQSLANQATELGNSNKRLENEIIERKRIEQALTSNKRLLENVFGSMHEGIFILDRNGRVIDFNNAFIRINKFKDREDVLKSIDSLGTVFRAYHLDGSFVPVEEWPATKALEGKTGTNQEFTVERTDLGVRWITSNSYAPLRDESCEIVGAIQTMHDITESKRAEQALKESEQRYHQLFSSMTEQFQLIELVYDEKGFAIDYCILDVNPAFERLVGKTREQLISKQVIKELWPVEQYWLDMFDHVLKTGEPAHYDNYGSAFDRFYELYVYRINGNQLATIGTDITERKKAEKALKESDERFRIALKNAPVSVAAQDLSLTYIWAYNQKTAQQDQIIGKSDSEVFTFHEAERLERIKRRVINEEVELREQLWLDRPLGKIYLDITWTPLHDEMGKVIGVTSATVDLTAMKLAQAELEEKKERLEQTQKKLEENACLLEEYSNQMEELAKQRLEKLKESERLAAVGATAGMVGHDIRNPLQAITGDLYLAKSEANDLPESEQKKAIIESLVETEKNVEYINKIVQDLQDYARPLNPKDEASDLKEIVEKLIRKNNIPNNIKVTVKIADEVRFVKTDSYYINRILHNLVTNAVQAMPKGGKLIIGAQKEAEGTIISIKDTGIGIPKSVQNKMFTIMFTTKSKGQGFGLPVVKRMTESLGGTVSFESEEGKGTTFTIRLPA